MRYREVIDSELRLLLAIRRMVRAVEMMVRRAPWIVRGMARFAPATGRR